MQTSNDKGQRAFSRWLRTGRRLAARSPDGLELKFVQRRLLGNASPRQIGQAAGSIAGNVAVAAASGAGISRISALRHARKAKMHPPDPPQIT